MSTLTIFGAFGFELLVPIIAFGWLFLVLLKKEKSEGE
jgi:hypothetical protein